MAVSSDDNAQIGTSVEQMSLFLAPSFILSEDELDFGLEIADQECGASSLGKCGRRRRMMKESKANASLKG